MVTSRWPRQPALDYLQQERYSVPLAARTIGVPTSHLKNVLYGRTRPMPEVKTGLSKLLGLPVDKLFTADILSRPYRPENNPWKPVQA
jgi:hypothetical protein